MKISVLLLSALVILLVTSSCQDQRKGKNWNDKTLADDAAINFIKNGIEGGLTEIKAAGLAKTQSTNPRVVNFANMIIADHTQVNAELKKIESLLVKKPEIYIISSSNHPKDLSRADTFPEVRAYFQKPVTLDILKKVVTALN